MKRSLWALLLIASCGDELGNDVSSDGGVPEAGVESEGGSEGGTSDAGTPSEAGQPDVEAGAYDAPADVFARCGSDTYCSPSTGCCVREDSEGCSDQGDCVGATYLTCSVSSQCGTGRCCVTPDDAGTYVATGTCRAACAPGDLILCDKDDSLMNHGCAAGQTCSGANLDTWGLAGVDTFAGCQPP